MSIQLKNNASGTLSTAISAADVGVALTYGDGANFPTLGVGDYFYATLVNTDNTFEIVKVTARSSDSITIVRAQENTSAIAFAAGALIELRATKQNIEDSSLAAMEMFTEQENTFSEDQTFDADVKIFGGNKVLIYNSADANPHGLRNASNSLKLDYNGTDYLSVNSSGVVSFTSGPLVGAGAIYYAGSTDVPITDGGTGASTASNARTNLGLAIGTDVQAYSALLASLAGVSGGADKLPYMTGGSAFSVADLTAYSRGLLAEANATDWRTELGLGSIATQAASSVAITGGTISGITSAQMRLKTSPESSGILTTLSANAIVHVTGDVTINPSVFSSDDCILLISNSSSHSVTQGSGMVLKLAGTSTTGTRTLAANGMCALVFNNTAEALFGGSGAS